MFGELFPTVFFFIISSGSSLRLSRLTLARSWMRFNSLQIALLSTSLCCIIFSFLFNLLIFKYCLLWFITCNSLPSSPSHACSHSATVSCLFAHLNPLFIIYRPVIIFVSIVNSLYLRWVFVSILLCSSSLSFHFIFSPLPFLSRSLFFLFSLYLSASLFPSCSFWTSLVSILLSFFLPSFLQLSTSLPPTSPAVHLLPLSLPPFFPFHLFSVYLVTSIQFTFPLPLLPSFPTLFSPYLPHYLPPFLPSSFPSYFLCRKRVAALKVCLFQI